MAKKFNVTGNCFSDRHYMADVSHKMGKTLQLVEFGEYFIINRPRQYGKTTTLFALGDALRKKDDFIALNMSFEGMSEQFFENDKYFARGFMQMLADYASVYAPDLEDWMLEQIPTMTDLTLLDKAITKLMNRTTKKVVILIDEVDQSSNNEVFIKFLALLRNKYLKRTAFKTFHSVILAGVHDVKLLKMKIRPEMAQQYNSPWNIATDYKVDLNLYPHEIEPMLEDYVQERSVSMNVQEMSYGLFYYTSGYPFLVSRLCKIMDEDLMPLKNEPTWTQADLILAVRRLIKENNTNFDSLIKNLENNLPLHDMIQRIVIDGDKFSYNQHNPTAHLALVYGILTNKNELFAVHNRIYQEVIINYMTSKMELLQYTTSTDFGNSYLKGERQLDMEAVVLGFQSFMKKEYSKKDRVFLERNGRLVFLAFLKPIINGAGYDFKEPQVSEEKRLDLAITYYNEKYIIELKIWRGEKAHQKGLIQLADYLESQQVEEGYLLIFDHHKIKNWSCVATIEKGKRIFIVWV
jgi:Predicted AAA-ATPase/PD-(D/E)XK nuclease superfamily